MKIKNLFYVSLAALSLAACSNDEEVVVPQDGSVVIDLATANIKAKATTGYEEENAMSTGFVYAFLNDNLVETKTFSTASNSVTFSNLTRGTEYTFVAVANSSESAATVDGFKTIKIEAPEAKENFVMYNTGKATVPAETGSANLSMTINRVLSAVQLANVTRAQSTVPSIYANASMEIKGLTLYNVNPSVNLDGAVELGTKENATDLAAEFSGKTIDSSTGTLAINGSTVGERAYACPTAGSDTDKPLFAVLEVAYSGDGIDGTITKYFNISLSALAANTLYALNVTITGVGSDGPGDPDEFGDATGAITPADWADGNVINAGNQEN